MRSTLKLLIGLFCLMIALVCANLLFAANGEITSEITVETEYIFPAWFTLLIGLVVPVVSQWVAKNLKTSNKKFWASLGVQIVCGIAGALILGITPGDLPGFLTAVFVLAQLSYRMWWKAIFEGMVGEAFALKPK